MNEGLLKRSLRAVGATALAIGLSFSFLAPAEATNKNTTPGNNSADCRIDWNASAVMGADLTNDDPEYPGLMVDPEGNPVEHYSNGFH